jgi:hypothetical protein
MLSKGAAVIVTEPDPDATVGLSSVREVGCASPGPEVELPDHRLLGAPGHVHPVIYADWLISNRRQWWWSIKERLCPLVELNNWLFCRNSGELSLPRRIRPEILNRICHWNGLTKRAGLRINLKINNPIRGDKQRGF